MVIKMGSISDGDAVFVFFVGCVLLFSVVNNFIVMIVVWKNMKMRNVTNVLICNLSASDIILGGIILPMNLHDLSHEDNFHEGRFACKIAFAFPLICITTASYTIAMMAYERRNCVVNSLKTQVSLRHCKVIIPVIWVLAFVVVTPSIIEFEVTEIAEFAENETLTHLVCNSDHVSYEFIVGNAIMLVFVTYIIPLSVILYSYVRIIYFCAQQKSKNTINQSTPQSVVLKKRLRIVKMLVLVAFLFAVSWLPYFVALLISKVSGSDGSDNTTGPIFKLKIFLAAFSTAYNVIVYTGFNPLFRDGYKEFIMCGKMKKVGIVTTDKLETTHETGISTISKP